MTTIIPEADRKPGRHMHTNLSSMTEQDRAVAGIVKAVRKGLGLTLDGLAPYVGLSKSTLSRIENEQRPLYEWERLGYASGAAQAIHTARAAVTR